MSPSLLPLLRVPSPLWAGFRGKWAVPSPLVFSKWAIIKPANFSPIPPFRRPSGRMPRVLITGATDGIGREAALRMAAADNQITISGRDPGKAEDVIRQCQKQFNNTPQFIQTDLSSDAEVVKFAKQVAEEQFDICILNAGIMMPKNARTAEDREATIMTNLISSYMIAHKILESRRDEQHPLHFVFSTSILVKFHCATPIGPRFFNPKKVSDWQKALEPAAVSGAGKYAISKIGLATLSSSISFADYPNVTATSVHPGTVYTNIMSNLPARQKLYIRLARPFITSLADAGENLVRAAECPLPGGMFYQTRDVAKLPEMVYAEKTLAAFDEVFQQFKIR